MAKTEEGETVRGINNKWKEKNSHTSVIVSRGQTLATRDYVGDMSGCVCPVSYRFWPFSPSLTGLKFDHTTGSSFQNLPYLEYLRFKR